jgi:hypothetical protein
MSAASKHLPRIGPAEPVPQLLVAVLADTAVDDDRKVTDAEVLGVVPGRIQRRQERERSFLPNTIGFVVDVVQNQAVDRQPGQPLRRDGRDLLDPLLGLVALGRRETEQEGA